MGIWKYTSILLVFVAIGLLSTGFIGLSEEALADKKSKENTT